MNDGLGLNTTQTWPIPRFGGKTRKAWLIIDGSNVNHTILDQWPSGSFGASGSGGYSTSLLIAAGLLPSKNGTIVRTTVCGDSFNCQAMVSLSSATAGTIETYANSATPASVGGPVYIEFWA